MIEAVLTPVPAIVGAEPAEEDLILTLPDGVRRMISAAVRLEDEAQLEAVLNTAALAYPAHDAAIKAYVEEVQAPSEPLTVAPHVVTAVPPEPPKYSFLENIEGRVHANAAYTDGNTETSTLARALMQAPRSRPEFTGSKRMPISAAPISNAHRKTGAPPIK